MRVLKREGDDLRQRENARGCHKRPEPAAMMMNEPIAADPGAQTPAERHYGEDADVHDLALLDEIFGGGVVVVVPEAAGVVADVVDGHEADAAEEAEHDEELPERGSAEEEEAGDVRFTAVVRVGDVWFAFVI